MGRTINGKPLSDVFNAIRQPKEPDDYLQGKYPYYKYGTYYNLAEECIGLDHYSFECIDKQFNTLNSSQESLSVCCRLTLLDDDYTPICSRDGWGTIELTYTDKGIRSGLKNDMNNALKAAFKSCMDAYGAFGKAQSDDEAKPNRRSNNNNTPAVKAGDIKVMLATNGAPKIERTDAQTNKPVYTVSVTVVENGSLTDKKGTLIFYPNQYGKVIERFNNVLAVAGQRAVSLNIVAKEKVKENSVSYVFKGFI